MKKSLFKNRLFLTSVKDEQNFVQEFCLTALFILLSILLPFLGISQKAKDGSYNYSPGSSGTVIVNRYAVLSASVSAGATSITVTNIADLSGSTSFTNSVNAFATAALSPGDLIMIIQIQGADMSTSNDATYGNITAYNNTGNYELQVVTSITSNTIYLCQGLTNAYGANAGLRQRTQVVRIPRLNNLTIGSLGILSALAWNGSVGGICAVEAGGNVTIQGQINVSATGFRGGVRVPWLATNLGSLDFRTANNLNGGAKGESIYGNSTDMLSMGQYAMGAPANGGGGGNSADAGGGGGANAGNNGAITPWNGTGIKPSGYNAAWDLEGVSFSSNISYGGGRGGYSLANNNQDALTVGAGNATWGGDSRRKVGGVGGRPLDYNSNTRLFFGGGGGAGDSYNSDGTSGANGGGIIYLLVTGSVTGGGTLNANGGNGANTNTSYIAGAGGGGGGGAIVVLSNAGIAALTATANGGNGGNTSNTGGASTGPGGGGGGGYIKTTTTAISRTVSAGNNGVSASSSLTEFPPNGATKGDVGTIASGTYFSINNCYKEINGTTTPTCTDVSFTITSPNTIINTYYPGTASVSAGATKISVGAKNSNSSTTAISPGDLLLVIQMQGSTINYTNTSAYGGGTTTYSGYLTSIAGKYEYVYAASGVINNTIYLGGTLKNSYTVSAATATAGQYTFQVVRVARYLNLIINAGASVTCPSWDGSSGGIIAINASGTITLNGGTVIDAKGKGFRGGAGHQVSGGSVNGFEVVSNAPTYFSYVGYHGSKGEGIAGTPRHIPRYTDSTLIDLGVEGYPGGSYAKGAPANAGGGGTDGDNNNSANSGGGGGGNKGAGGRGGHTYNNNLDHGGYGGVSLTSIAQNNLIFGGGGGAGTTNNGTAAPNTFNVKLGFCSSGGQGGGLVFIFSAAVSGTGSIDARGNDGLSAGQDGGGGGGGGGSVYFYSANGAGLTNVTINAAGGRGGDAWAVTLDDGTPNNGAMEHGPGGGGGGGVVYTNAAINAASSAAGGAHGITTTSNRDYYSTNGAVGSIFTNATGVVVPTVRIFCDIDDDDDGIADVMENPLAVEPFSDPDNDGIPNCADNESGVGGMPWQDANGDGYNDYYDADSDGIINELDLDSDNDGIPDVVESYGVDTNGDGKIDNFVDVNGDGLSDNAAVTSAVNGIGAPDIDGDLIPNFADIDSDGDGIPDIVEVGGVDANNNGMVDGFTDTNFNGLNDANESTTLLLLSGSDINNDGIADSWPNKNLDRTGRPNPYDLDSDGDGILDMIEAGFTGSNGIASGSLAYGWSKTIKILTTGSLISILPNIDGVGNPDYLDIDSDNDGITDNVEAQSTSSYFVPTDTDTDGDGIADVYETAPQIGTFGGSGLTPFDKDGDAIPDYKDTDTDGDGVPDRNEGDRNAPFKSITQATIDAGGDTDGDGLMNSFDNVNLGGLATNYYLNVTMSNMGPLGGFDGPTPSGSLIQLQKSDALGDRDWRNATILPLNIVKFTALYNEPTAKLSWTVENEYQTSNYAVEYSTDGLSFEKVGEAAANNIGKSDYSFNHVPNKNVSTVYYRIKQIDKSGKDFYSKIVAIKLGKATATVSVYPNPFVQYMNVSIGSQVEETVVLQLISTDGKIAKTINGKLQKGLNTLQMTDLSNMAKGNYYLRIISNNIQTTQQVIKIN